jgi:DNA-binding MarR family transcriptional regulator
MARNKTVIAEILRTARRLTTARDALLADFGMTSAKLRLLKTIRRLPTPFSISALARHMDVSRQAARATVRELEAAGLISVALDPFDRKAHIVVLTPLGRARLEDVQRIEEKWVAGLTDGFADRSLAQAAWLIRIVRERATTARSSKRRRPRSAIPQ